MEVDSTTPAVSAVTRNRSYSHQVTSSSMSAFQIPPTNPHHRLNFEFNLEDHIKKTRKAASYLRQVFHSQQCGGQCSSAQCKRIVKVLFHIQGCNDAFCAIGGCNTTKKLLRHSLECQSSSCGNGGINAPAPAPTSNSSSFTDTPRTSVDSTVSSLSSSGISSALNLGSPGSLGRLGSPQQQHFCLLCTLARSDTLTPRTAAVLGGSSSFGSGMMMDIDNDIYSPSVGDDDDDLRFMPIISDEIIEFSKIPFQRRSHAVHALSPARSKTYSDSLYMEPSNVHGSISGSTAPMSPAVDQPSKKFRSKSLNAASPSLELLQKQLQQPQPLPSPPFVGAGYLG